LAGPMNAGSIFFLNVQTWQSHDVIFYWKANAEESVSNSIPTQPTISTQPTMHESESLTLLGGSYYYYYYYYYHPVLGFSEFSKSRNPPPSSPHFQVFKKKINTQKQK
jgi:hypothetical protein